jgi:DNA-binding MarR family transcriptional regulator
MRDAGLVEQAPDPADGRARVLSLTARGDAMVAAAIRIGTDYEAALTAQLGPRQAGALRTGLESIVEQAGAASDLAARRVRSL